MTKAVSPAIIALYVVGVITIGAGAWFAVGDGPVSGAGHIALFVAGFLVLFVGKYMSLGREEDAAAGRHDELG